MPEIITIGEILVEIMAKHVDQTFQQTGEFVGPFPSGAPAIFIDQATKTGSKTAILSKVGNDGFGKLNIERLQKDGVDVRYIETMNEKTTGIAFVTYQENGERDFIFTIRDSAAACITQADVTEELFEGCRYFHIMGCSAFHQELILTLKKAITLAKAKGVKISFDPNIRKELMENEELKAFILFALENCDIFLPGEEELRLITGMDDEEKAVHSIREKGVQLVVVKRGKRGSRTYLDGTTFDVEPLTVQEVDPTGAGDCFAGTLISLLNQEKSVQEAVRLANASGAYAVTKRGPMEGTATLDELENFILTVGGNK